MTDKPITSYKNVLSTLVITRKGVILLTREGLVTNVLDSSLDLGFYAFMLKRAFMLAGVFRELGT